MSPYPAIDVQGINSDTTAQNIGIVGVSPVCEGSTSQVRDEGTFLYVGGQMTPDVYSTRPSSDR
jgi:hypothetical protein